MGDPKYSRRVWRKPKRPLNYELKMEELKTLGTFGLRTKRELWKAHTELSRVRHQARSLLALRQEDREKKEPVLMASLARIGLVKEGSTLDDVLNLNVNDLLRRRLQTIVSDKLGFKTPYQARQAVTHGHIMIGDRRVDIPSYTVRVDEESMIKFTPGSKIPQMLEKQQVSADVGGPVDEENAQTGGGAQAAAGEAPEQAAPGQAGAGGADGPAEQAAPEAAPDQAAPDAASGQAAPEPGQPSDGGPGQDK